MNTTIQSIIQQLNRKQDTPDINHIGFIDDDDDV
jgi:hypothetical protein